MSKLENNSYNKEYKIPLEVTAESKPLLIANGYDTSKAIWTKIGYRTVRAIMIPVTKEQYYEYMRSLWREDKREQRFSKEEDVRKMKPISLDKMYEETGYETSDNLDLEDSVMKKMMIDELHKTLDELEEIDRMIMDMFSKGDSETVISKKVNLSQKGVNKRKNRILLNLKGKLQGLE